MAERINELTKMWREGKVDKLIEALSQMEPLKAASLSIYIHQYLESEDKESASKFLNILRILSKG